MSNAEKQLCAPREHIEDLDNPGFCMHCGASMALRPGFNPTRIARLLRRVQP